MPELKQGFEKAIDFVPDEIDVDSIPYRDKNREIQRKKKLEILKSQPKPIFKKKAESWSQKKDQKDKKNERKIKKGRKKLYLLMKKADEIQKLTTLSNSKSSQNDDVDDYKEYLKEKGTGK